MKTIALMTHLNSSSEVVNHPYAHVFWYGTNLLIDGHFEFSNGLGSVLRHVVLHEPNRDKNLGRGFHIRWMQISLGFAAPADQPIRESIVESLHHDVGSMWSCPILLEPLHISIHTTTTYSKGFPELFQHIYVTFLWDSDCLLVCVFKPKQSDYSMFSDGHLGRAFHRVQGHLKLLYLSTHSYCYWHVHRARSVLRHWTNPHQGS